MNLVFFVFAGVIGSSLAAHSADLRPYNVTAGYMFVINDKNEDGVLSKTEFDGVFGVYDYNGDGVIERHEYVCMITAENENLVYVSHAIYDDYDVNGDHRLDKTDFDAFYKKMDADGDDQVSYQEFVMFWTKLLVDTENYSLHGHPHPHHHDKYCEQHGHRGHQPL